MILHRKRPLFLRVFLSRKIMSFYGQVKDPYFSGFFFVAKDHVFLWSGFLYSCSMLPVALQHVHVGHP
jgi:hypothetical protein